MAPRRKKKILSETVDSLRASLTTVTFFLPSIFLDATVVVGDVSDEESILNAAFINKKVSGRKQLFSRFLNR
jgi:arginine exporter protein ArgO